MLQWALAGAVVLSIAALWWPQPVDTAAHGEYPAMAAVRRAASERDYLPAELRRQTFEPAEFDPFIGAMPPKPPVPTPVESNIVVESPLHPPVPAPLYRYLGQMIDPGGAKRMFLGKDDTMIPIEAGSLLDDGYVVDAVENDAIRLRHPPTGTQVSIAVPPPDEWAGR